jgi:hypothetical protein
MANLKKIKYLFYDFANLKNSYVWAVLYDRT